jgi:hypothetical protein
MVLNSIGVYGFLSRAHLEHPLAGDLTVVSKAADIDAHLEAKQADLNDIKARIARLDQTRTVATKGHTKATTVGDQGAARAALVHEREAAETALANLRIEKARVDGERKAVEADLDPVRYLATCSAAPTSRPCAFSSTLNNWSPQSPRRYGTSAASHTYRPSFSG